MKASQNCINLIKQFEGFVPHPYQCPAGIWTIGYGSTRYINGTPVSPNDKPITEEQASQIAGQTLVEYENAVNRYVTALLTQNQFDALVDFAYNAGSQNLRTATLLKRLNEGNYSAAADEFGKWVMGGGKRLSGLVKRRAAERELFLKG